MKILLKRLWLWLTGFWRKEAREPVGHNLYTFPEGKRMGVVSVKREGNYTPRREPWKR